MGSTRFWLRVQLLLQHLLYPSLQSLPKWTLCSTLDALARNHHHPPGDSPDILSHHLPRSPWFLCQCCRMVWFLLDSYRGPDLSLSACLDSIGAAANESRCLHFSRVHRPGSSPFCSAARVSLTSATCSTIRLHCKPRE